VKIAQVAPLIESVPPLSCGGTKRVVFWITEELVRQGAAIWLYELDWSRAAGGRFGSTLR
jgi:hypothetical protein